MPGWSCEDRLREREADGLALRYGAQPQRAHDPAVRAGHLDLHAALRQRRGGHTSGDDDPRRRRCEARLLGSAETGAGVELGPAEAARLHCRPFGGRRAPVDALARPVRACLQLQSLPASLRHGARAQTLERDEYEGLLAVLVRTRPADAHVADAGGVVLQLVLARLVGVELVDEQDVGEAARGDARPVADLEHAGAIGEAHGRAEPERIARSSRAGRRLHRDAGLRPVDAMDPGRRLDDLAVLIGLRVLAELPDIAGVVLREEGDLGLDELARAEVPVPHHDRAHPVDRLRQVGDRRDEAMADRLRPLDRPSPVGELHAGMQRLPRVVDDRRVREAGAVVAVRRARRARAQEHERRGREQDGR